MNANHLKGQVNELKAQLWFASQGYEIFIPLLTQTYYDMVVSKNNKLYSVQVKTAHYITAREQKYLQCRLGRTNRKEGARCYSYEDTADFLFVVHEDGYWLIPKEQLPLDKKTLYFNSNKKSGYDPAIWKVA